MKDRRFLLSLILVGTLSAATLFSSANPAGAQGTGSISGHVADSGGNAIAGIWVTASSGTCGWGRLQYSQTDASGNYQLMDLWPSDVYVSTSNDLFYIDQSWNGVTNCTAATAVTVAAGQETHDINFSLALGGKISGLVVAQGGAPLAGIRMDAHSGLCGDGWLGNAWTDGSGNYTIASMPAGQVHVHAASDDQNYVSQWWNGVIDCNAAAPVTVTVGLVTNVSFTLAPGGSLSGKVTDAAAQTLAGIWLHAADAKCSRYALQSGQTDADGNYSLIGLPAGNVYVSTHNQLHYIEQSWNGVTDCEDASPVPVAIGQDTPNIDFSLSLPGQISGRITAGNNEPLAGIRVVVYSASCSYDSELGYAETNGDGTYEVQGLSPGQLFVRTWSGGNFVDEWWSGVSDCSASTPVAVSSGQAVVGIDFSLAAGGRIRGHIADRGGAPIAGVYVTASLGTCNDNNYLNYGQTDAAGDYVIRGLPAGSLSVRTWSFGSNVDQWWQGVTDCAAATPVTVAAGQETLAIDFALDRINFPPVALDDAYSTSEDTALTIAAPGVLGNDSDADGNSLIAVKVADPSHGTISFNADGSFTYTPSLNFTGADSFTYQANDGISDSAPATVSITVTPRLSAPFPIATTAGKEIGFAATFDGTNFLVGILGNAVSSTAVTGQRVSQAGALVGERIDTGRTGEPSSIAFDGTNHLMYWTESGEVYGRFVGTDGSLVGNPFVIGGGEVGSLVYGGGAYLALYHRGSWLHGRMISPAGVVGGEFALSTNARKDAVAFDGTNFLVVWCADDNSILGMFVNPQGLQLNDLVIDGSTAPSDNPLWVAFNGTNYLVTWMDAVGSQWDIFGRLVTPEGALPSPRFTISDAPGRRFAPMALAGGGHWLVTWGDWSNDADQDQQCDAGEGTCGDVFGRFYDPDGTPDGAIFGFSAGPHNQAGGVRSFADGKFLCVIDELGDTGFDGPSGDVYGVFVTPPFAPPAQEGTIQGTIAFEPGGLAPNRVDVEIYDASGQMYVGDTWTDAARNWNYNTGGLPAGTYRVQFRPDGGSYFAEYWQDGTPAGIAVTVGNSTVINPLLNRGGAIVGTVGFASGGIPTTGYGVGIHIYRADDGQYVASSWTDPSMGWQYSSGALPDGSYKIFVDASYTPYFSEWWEDQPDQESGTTVTVASPDLTTVNPLLNIGAAISGTISFAAGGTLPDSVSVDIYHAVSGDYIDGAWTDAAAGWSYRSNGLDDGDYRVQFYPHGGGYRAEWWQDQADFSSATTVNTTAASPATVSPTLDPETVISGTIAFAPGGALPYEVYVYLYRASDQGYVDSSHAYAFDEWAYAFYGLAPGDYRIQFVVDSMMSSSPYLSEWWENQPDFSSATTVTASVGTTTVNPTLDIGGSISGTIAFTTGGTIPGYVYVSVYSAGTGDYVTAAYAEQADGWHFATGVLSDGDYKVLFNPYDGGTYKPEWWQDQAAIESATAVTVISGGPTDINPTLDPYAMITGTVAFAAGGNLPSYLYVTLFRADNGEYISYAYTDAYSNWSYSFLGLNGDYKVLFEPYGGNYLSEWWENQPDFASATPVTASVGTTTVNPTLNSGVSIAGTIAFTPGGTIPEHVQVSVYSAGTGDYVAEVSTGQADGWHFATGLLPDGDYKVLFYPYGGGTYKPEWWQDQPVIESATSVTVSTGGPTDVSPTLDPDIVIAGTVAFAAGGNLPDALYVSLYRADSGESVAYANTDAYLGWSYCFLGLSGDYKVQFQPYGGSYLAEWWQDQLDLESATTVTASVGTTSVSPTLNSGGYISGNIAFTPGGIVPGYVSVSVHSAGTGDYVTVAYADQAAGWHFATGALPDGEYKVFFNPFGEGTYKPEWWQDQPVMESATAVAVSTGGPTEVNPTLDIGKSISGTVGFAAGVTAPDSVSVYLYRADSAYSFTSTATTAADGWHYTFGGLLDGGYKLYFSPSGGSCLPQFWENQTDIALATVVDVTAGDATVSPTLESCPLPPVQLAPFPIATTSGKETGFSAAFDATNFLVGILGSAAGDTAVTAQRVSQTGDLVGELIDTGRTGDVPRVAFDGTNYLLAWKDGSGGLYGQFVGTEGSLVGSPFEITASPAYDLEGFGFGGGVYLAAYAKERKGQLFGKTIQPNGALGGEFVISGGAMQGAYGLAFDGTSFFVPWTNSEDGAVKGRFVSPSGTMGAEFTIDASPEQSDNSGGVGYDGTNYLVVWPEEVAEGNWDFFGRLVSPSGAFPSSRFAIAETPGMQFYPSVIGGGGRWLVAWNDWFNDTNLNMLCEVSEGTCWDVFGRFFDPDGTPQGGPFPITAAAHNQFGVASSHVADKFLCVINEFGDTGFDGPTGDVSGVFVSEIAPPAHPPVAVEDSYSTPEDTALVVAAPGVLGNDTDADGDSLTALKVSDPVHGTLSLGADGSFTYTPAASYSGPDSFTYMASDGTADSNLATVSITVMPVQTPLVISNVRIPPERITDVSVSILWDTDQEATTGVEYWTGTEPHRWGLDPVQYSFSHDFSLSGLTPDTQYFFVIWSEVDPGNRVSSGSTPFEFTTAVDQTPPETYLTTVSPANGKFCDSAINVCWGGTDDATPVAQLQYSYSLDNASWSGWSAEACQQLAGLAEGAHTLQVRVQDLGGNIDQTPAELAFVVDTIPPDISDITAAPWNNSSSAVVNWRTDEQSTTQVECGLTSAYGLSSQLDLSLVESHTVILQGLIAGTAYHFRVRSSDGCNETVSEDGTFNTATPQPPETEIVSGPPEGQVIGPNISFAWAGSDALTPADSLVYSFSVDDGAWTGYGYGTNLPLIVLPAGPHTFAVKSRDLDDLEDPTPAVRHFTVDADPPVISNVVIPPERITDAAASVTWETDEPSSSQVEYWNSAEPHRWISDPAQTASHRLPLSGLAPGTTYHVILWSEDAFGNRASSGDPPWEFTTLADQTPPETYFTSGQPEGGLSCASNVVLCWSGSDNGSSAAELSYSFRIDSGEWSIWDQESCHGFEGLADGSHTVEVKARDIVGNEDPTPSLLPFVVDTVMPVISDILVTPRDYQSKILWKTSEPTTSQVEYGETQSYGSATPVDSWLTTDRTETIDGLEPQTTYHFRARSSDGCREAISEDMAFTTTEVLYPNLRIVEAQTPETCIPLAPISIQWLARNQGLGAAQGAWVDKVFLSSDDQFDDQDALVAEYTWSDGLAWETEMMRTGTLVMPDKPPGTYTLFLLTDAGNSIFETGELDNLFALRIEFLKVKRLTATPDQIAVNLHPGMVVSGEIDLTNLGGIALTGIVATVEGGSSNVSVLVNPPSSLLAMSTHKVGYSVTASDESVAQSTPVLKFTTAAGEEATVNLSVTVNPGSANLVANPGYLETTMLRGTQKFIEFEVMNNGSLPAHDVMVLVPSAPWLSLLTPVGLGTLEPGAKAKVGLTLKPSATMALGPYTGDLALSGSNTVVSVSFRFTAVSDNRGGLSVLAQDEYSYFADARPPVAGAAVRVTNPYDGSLVVEGITGADGIFTKGAVIEGYYDVQVTADKHGTYKETIQIVAGEASQVKAFLPRQLVSYTWKVVPVQIEDRYTIALEATFETFVPAPVVTVDPAYKIIPVFEGETSTIYYTITNHGLIAALGVRLGFAEDEDYFVEPMIRDIGTLPAKSAIVVPVRVRAKRDGPLGQVPEAATLSLTPRSYPQGGVAGAAANGVGLDLDPCDISIGGYVVKYDICDGKKWTTYTFNLRPLYFLKAVYDAGVCVLATQACIVDPEPLTKAVACQEALSCLCEYFSALSGMPCCACKVLDALSDVGISSLYDLNECINIGPPPSGGGGGGGGGICAGGRCFGTFSNPPGWGTVVPCRASGVP